MGTEEITISFGEIPFPATFPTVSGNLGRAVEIVGEISEQSDEAAVAIMCSDLALVLTQAIVFLQNETTSVLSALSGEDGENGDYLGVRRSVSTLSESARASIGISIRLCVLFAAASPQVRDDNRAMLMDLVSNADILWRAAIGVQIQHDVVPGWKQ